MDGGAPPAEQDGENEKAQEYAEESFHEFRILH